MPTDRGETLVKEAVTPILMGCSYPKVIVTLLPEHDFAIVGTWGGYHVEAFGEGDEQVAQLRDEQTAPDPEGR